MAEIAKSKNGVSLATALPSHSHMIGPDLNVGESLGAFDACYIAASGVVLRSLANQNSGSAVNDVQALTITGNPTDGTYILAYPPTTPGSGGANFTAPLAWNANAAAIQAALVALPGVGAGGFVVSGTFPNFVATAGGGLAGMELPLIVADPSLLSNSSNPDVRVSKTTVGQPAGAGGPLAQSRIRGWNPHPKRVGEPITLYDSCIVGYSDQLLTPGMDVFLSGTVAGGLADAATYTGQKPCGFAMDNSRVFLFSVS